MTDEPTVQSAGVPPSAVPEGSFVDRFVWTFTSPRRLYEDIDRGVQWWQPWVWLSVINMVVAYITTPIQLRMTEINPNLTPEQAREAVENMERFGFLGVITTPIAVLLASALFAGVSYAVINVMADNPSFKKYFTLYLYANLVMSLGLVLGALITRMRGVENIRGVEDAVASFGPAALLGPGHKILYPILSTLDLFYLWFYALVGYGIAHIFRLGPRAAVIAVVPLWLLHVLFELIAVRLRGFS